jgi:hypothetical protein
MPDQTYEVTATHKITTQDLKDVLCMTFEGGSNYWIAEWKLCAPWRKVGTNHYVNDQGGTAEHFHEIPALGGIIQVRELGEPCLWHHVTINGLLRGITRAAQKGRIKLGDEDWLCQADAGDCDVILQYALLNEIRYG